MREVLTEGRDAHDEMHLTGERVLIVNQQPALWAGRRYGTVTTLRDRTELEALTGELDTTRAFAESLRSQAHETADRLHTMIVLIETGRGEEAVRYATSQLELSQRLTDRIMGAVDEPVLAALLLGKAAQASERGVELSLDVEGTVAAAGIPAPDLVTVVGNLVDNAIDASAESASVRTVRVVLHVDEQSCASRWPTADPGCRPSSSSRRSPGVGRRRCRRRWPVGVSASRWSTRWCAGTVAPSTSARLLPMGRASRFGCPCGRRW